MNEFALTPKILGDKIKSDIDHLEAAYYALKNMRSDSEIESIINSLSKKLVEYDEALSGCMSMEK